MANQLSGPPAQSTKSIYIAFIFLLLESTILATSTVWESCAPQWANPILAERGPLLGVATAVALLLSLLLAWNPTGRAKYATLSSGVLGFAAATHSLKPEDLSLGLALLALTLPFFVVMLPNLHWPRSKADWVSLSSVVLFFTVAAMSVMLGIKPVTEAVVAADIRGLGELVVVAFAAGVLFICGIVIIRLTIQVVVHFVSGWGWPYRLWLRINSLPRKNRAERRRQRRRRR